jgi:DNA-binding MarR family transcriptional regulator
MARASSWHDKRVPTRTINDADYQQLLEFRTGLRRYLRWSEQEAEAVGLSPAQHQLLLAVRGHDGEAGPTVGDVAEHLLLRHHSAVELVNRAEAAGLVRRKADSEDGRVVRVRLTPKANRLITKLNAHHGEELKRLGASVESLTGGLQPTKHLPPDRRPVAKKR